MRNAIALAVLLAVMACAAHGGEGTGRPILSAAIGDSLEDVRRQSTADVRTVEGDPAPYLVQVARPFDFHFRYNGQELAIPDPGGEPRVALLQFSAGNGRLIGITVNPAREAATLEEAIATARELRAWFEANGFERSPAPEGRASAVAFVSQSFEPVPYPIDSYDAIRRAWGDSRARVSEMTMLAMHSEGYAADLEVLNFRRKREYAGLPVEDGDALTEREYSIILTIRASNLSR